LNPVRGNGQRQTVNGATGASVGALHATPLQIGQRMRYPYATNQQINTSTNQH
jgi:hypothetical protein